METIAKTGERVRSSSSRSRNQKIDEEIVGTIAHYSEQGAAAMESRVKELDRKWDIERTLEVNAGLLGINGRYSRVDR